MNDAMNESPGQTGLISLAKSLQKTIKKVSIQMVGSIQNQILKNSP